MVELVRAGREPADLAREFEPSALPIRNWVAQADRQDGRREVKAAADAGLSAAEREELTRPGGRTSSCAWRATFALEQGLVGPPDRRDPVRIFGFMSANQACFPITVMARMLGAPKAGYHAGAIARPRRMPERMRCCWPGSRRCTSARGRPMGHRVSMPSCAPPESDTAASGLPG